ncbi:MAG: DUF4350 domain-containing protein [Actinomycetes bacterium]
MTARWRTPVAIVLLVILTALLLALVNSDQRTGLLDPRSPAPSGSLALAELLRNQGVTLDVADTADAAAAALAEPATATVFVAYGEYLGPVQIGKLSAAAHVILINPSVDALSHYAPGLAVTGDPLSLKDREPNCTLPAAVAAGEARMGGTGYHSTGSDRSGPLIACYGSSAASPLVQLANSAGPTVTVVGSGSALTNERLGQDGNAALAMNLLGDSSHLVWYLPTLGELLTSIGQQERKSLWQLIPSGWKWAMLQALLAGVLFALWRARRLGPVVTEPLPVVVRAAEATEGRARLYRKIKATDRAADALRAAGRDRLAPMVGLTATSDPHAVTGAIAHRTGRPAPEVGSLLYGAAPASDEALVKLADELDSLTREVRRQ